MISGLFWTISFKRFEFRIISLTLFIYCIIGFIPITNTYRTASEETLLFYLFGLNLFFLGVSIPNDRGLPIKKERTSLNNSFKVILLAHLIIIYFLILYSYLLVGNFIINQELRLIIPAWVGYIIRSSIYVPLITCVSINLRKIKIFDFLFYIILPLIPSIIIGARGTFILGLLSIVVALNIGLNLDMKGSIVSKYKENKKKIILLIALSSLTAIYSLFILRRNGTNLMSYSETLQTYFGKSNMFLSTILPLYLGFKETIGITDKIIINNFSNVYLKYPLFLAEFVTILPGEQLSPGKVVSSLIFGEGIIKDKGYTPGIFGGFYLDFGIYFTLIILFLIGLLIGKSIKNVRSSKKVVLNSFFIVTFLHLFHRGFLKPEYLFQLGMILFYLKLTRSKWSY